jgi:stage V sporulation protein AD
MAQKIGKRTIFFDNKPSVLSYASAVGKKEHEGPLSEEFDFYSDDSLFGEKTFEKAESKLQKTAVNIALEKVNLTPDEIDHIFAGDLLNQCIGSSFHIRDLGIPFIGLYGACSTMVLSTALASIFVDSGISKRAIAVTSSHFCSAERQYRFPLDYGSQRTPTAQWTVTGSGALILSLEEKGPYIHSATFGEIEDLGVTDANNMGAAMAPDDVKIRPYPKLEGMVFFYTQICIKGGLLRYI